MISLKTIFVLLGTFCLAQAYTAPSTLSKFRPVLSKAKLQAPESNTAATSSSLLNGYAHAVFHLQGGSFMQFQMRGNSRRSELRELETDGDLAAWSVAGSRTLNAKIALPSQVSGLEEVTFLQVHCGPKPALRVSWRKSYSRHNDAIISNVRVGLGKNDVRKKFLVTRNAATTSYRVEVRSSRVKVIINGRTVLDASLEFWRNRERGSGPSCYFKAGAYVNNPTSSSATARTKFRELSW